MEVERESAKTSELNVIDTNRRIDRLMSEKSNLEKSYRSQKQTCEFIERSLDDLKEEKLTVENKVETISAQLELEKVNFETHKSEYESNMAILNDDISKLKESHSNDSTEKETDIKQIKEQYELKIEEEIEKQRIVERKAAVTVRELKKQLSLERADKLAEKLKQSTRPRLKQLRLID